MSTNTDQTAAILECISAVREHLLAEAIEWGPGPAPRRYSGFRPAMAGFPTASCRTRGIPAERQRLSRAVRELVAAGVLETQYRGRAKEIRITPPPTVRERRRTSARLVEINCDFPKIRGRKL